MPDTAALDELERLLHGPLPKDLRAQIQDALTAAAPHQQRGRSGSIEQITHLASRLPTARELLENPRHLAAVQAWTAAADPSLYMSALLHYTLCAGTLIQLADTPQQVKAHLDALDSGHAKGLFLITEIGQASSHLKTRTEAVFDPVRREFILRTPDASAAKISSASPDGGPQIAIVFARLHHTGTDHGVFPFVVNLTSRNGPTPGVEISGPLAVNNLPLRYGLIRFTGARVPYSDWLSAGASINDRAVFHDPNPTLDSRLTRALTAGAGLYSTIPTAVAAAARISAVLALRYSENRTSHGRLAPRSPILAYRTHQNALLSALAEAFAITCTARLAAEAWPDQPPSPAPASSTGMSFAPWSSLGQDLAVYKLAATDAAVRVTTECQQRCGLNGMLDINRLPAYHGLTQAFLTAGGDNQLIALDTGRALAQSPAPTEQPPAPRSSVYDAGWWPAVASIHQHKQTAALRSALETRARFGAEDLELWNPLLDQAAALGRAHADHLTAQAVAHTLDTITTPELRTALRLLAALYGIKQARRLSGSLITTGTITPQTARSLPAAANTLCEQLMPRLPLLKELAGFDTDLITAPMAAPDYATALTSILTWQTGAPS